MSDQTWYYIDATGAQQGPITIPQLQALAANGGVTRETQVWTHALGEQWIPAANVEGLFVAAPVVPARPILATPPIFATPATPANPATPAAPAAPAPAPAPTNPSTPATLAAPVPTLNASPSTVRTPARVKDIIAEEDIQQPLLAPTTPMMPSTPTTQAVTGVPVPATPAANSQLSAQQPTLGAVQSPQPEQNQPSETKKKASILGILILLIGLGAAAYGGYEFSQKGASNLNYSLMGGGGLFAIIGLILTIKGKTIPVSSLTSATSSPALGSLSGTQNPATESSQPAIGGLTGIGSTPVAPVAPAVYTPATEPAKPSEVNPSPAQDKPNPFAGVNIATKPNPLLANPDAVKPQNKLNTAVAPQSTAEEAQDPS